MLKIDLLSEIRRNNFFNLIYQQCRSLTSRMKRKHLQESLLTCNQKNNNNVFGDPVDENTPVDVYVR